MIEEARNSRNHRTTAITEDQILHRAIVSPDVKKIQDQLKAKDAAKQKAAEQKGESDGELREPNIS